MTVAVVVVDDDDQLVQYWLQLLLVLLLLLYIHRLEPMQTGDFGGRSWRLCRLCLDQPNHRRLSFPCVPVRGCKR